MNKEENIKEIVSNITQDVLDNEFLTYEEQEKWERLQQQLSKKEKRWNDLKEWTESIRPYYPDDNNHLQLFKDKIKELEEQE